MRRRFPIVPALVAILVSLAVAAVAASAWKSDATLTSPGLKLSSQRLKLSQSRANQALIRVPNARPGQIARGTTTMSVTGQRAAVMVRLNNPRDFPGSTGGRLIASRRLWIDIRCVGRPCPRPVVAYRGPMSRMATRNLGTWPAGVSYRYLVRVWLQRGAVPPTPTTGDNVFQGSKARFGLVWTATGI